MFAFCFPFSNPSSLGGASGVNVPDLESCFQTFFSPTVPVIALKYVKLFVLQ